MSIIDLAAILVTALALYLVRPVKQNRHAQVPLHIHTW